MSRREGGWCSENMSICVWPPYKYSVFLTGKISQNIVQFTFHYKMFFYGFCDMGGRGNGWGAVSHFIMPFKLLFLGELAADS